MKIYDGSKLSINNTLIYFYANWMPFHHRMMNVIKKLDESECTILVVDVDSFKEFTKANNITNVPTFVFYKNKKEVKKIEGMQLSTVIRSEMYNIYIKDKK